MLATEYPIIADAAVSIHEMTAEEKIRALCETREDYECIELTYQTEIAELQEQLNESNSENALLRARIAALEAQLNK